MFEQRWNLFQKFTIVNSKNKWESSRQEYSFVQSFRKFSILTKLSKYEKRNQTQYQ